MTRLRLAFLGTPDFSARILATLIAAGHEVAMVYAQPPRPAGRGHRLTASPVQRAAAAAGLAVRTPARLGAWRKRPTSRRLASMRRRSPLTG